MMTPSFVDMSRPTVVYAAGLGFLMLASLLVSNLPALALSSYVDIPYRREICAALFIVGAGFGVAALQRHTGRAAAPWKIPQSQITLPYLAFFFSTLLAIIVAH